MLTLFHQGIKTTLIILSVGSLAGCLGTFKTHVTPEGGFKGVTIGDCAESYGVALCNEFAYTDGWIQSYIKAGGNPSLLTSSIATLTIPAAAVAAFYGISGNGSADRISRLTLGAASAYALGTFYGGKGKQAIYFEGAKAMTCLQISSVPALVLESDKNYLANLKMELDALLTELSAISNLPALAAPIIANGKTLSQAAQDYLSFVQIAPYRMRATTNTIAIEVDRLLAEQSPTLESLMSLAGSLNGIAGKLVVQSTPSTTTGAPQSGISPELEKQQKDIGAKLQKVKALSESIRQKTNSLNEQKAAFAKIEQCGPQSQVTTFTITPANASLSVEVSKTLELIIADSTGFPSVTSNSDFVEVEPLTVKGNALALTITGKKATDVNGVQVVIHSASGKVSHSVNVIVAAAQAQQLPKESTTKTDSKTTEAAKPLNDLEKEVFKDPEQVLRLQCAVNLPEAERDCVMGPNTRNAMKKHLENETGALTVSLRNALDQIEINDTCSKAKCRNSQEG